MIYLHLSPVEPSTHADDEYARAGVFDPKILITTSRDPSSRLQQFSKVLSHFWQLGRRNDVLTPHSLFFGVNWIGNAPGVS